MRHGNRRSLVDGRREANRMLPQYLASALPSTWEGFESAADWTPGPGATVNNDTVNVKQGAQSMNIAGNGTNIYMQRTVSWNIPADCKWVFLWIYVADATKLNSVVLFLSSRADFAYYAQSPSITNLTNGWNFIRSDISAWSIIGPITMLSTMIRFRVRMSSSAETNISVDDLQIGLVTQPAVLLAFDDGWDSSYLQGFAYANPRGIRATEYTISSTVGNAGIVTTAQLQEMARGGWDIANHSSNNTDFTTLTQGEIETNLSTCATALEAIGIGDSRLHVAYPSGGYDADTFAAMTATGMLTGRTTVANIFTIWEIEHANKWYELPIYTLNSVNNINAAISQVDIAIAKGAVLIFLLHKLAVAADAMTWPISSWQTLTNYLVNRNVPTLTITELYALRDGPVSIRNYRP